MKQSLYLILLRKASWESAILETTHPDKKFWWICEI